jgi:hypothetical protein
MAPPLTEQEIVTDRHGNKVVIEGVVPFGKLDPLKIAAVPTAIGMFAWIGPGLLWAALAQGSGELIWWPYLTAKYGTGFLGFLLPASLIQWWYNHEIIRYELMTGENAMTAFIRIGKWYAWIVTVMIAWEVLWFGGFTAASGGALAALTKFPAGWGIPGQTRFWTYALIIGYLLVLFLGPIVYNWVERISVAVTVVTVIGILVACFQPQVYNTFGAFWSAFFNPFSAWPLAGWPAKWDPKDTSILVTSIAFAGAGGWGQVFFCYWFRDKGASMGAYAGRVTSPITGELETIPATGFAFKDTPENRRNFEGWLKVAAVQNTWGIFFNTLTTAIMCWLAWAILMPQGKFPGGWALATVQADFFSLAWGEFGRVLFLIVAAFFLADAWLQVIDGYCRMEAEFIYGVFPDWSRRYPLRTWYYICLAFAAVCSLATVAVTVPQFAILMRGVASFVAMPIMGVAFIYLNFYMAPKVFPNWVLPNKFNYIMMWVCTLTYVVLFLWWMNYNKWFIF